MKADLTKLKEFINEMHTEFRAKNTKLINEYPSYNKLMFMGSPGYDELMIQESARLQRDSDPRSERAKITLHN